CMVVVIAALFVTGCVSTGKYDSMEAAKNKEIADLQQQKDSLEQQKAAKNKEIADLQQQKASLEQQKADLDKAIAEQTKQVEAAEKEKASLMQANQQSKQQYQELLQGLSKEVEKGQLQVRQYKNMLAVDLAEQIFFDSGRATLKPGGKEVLKKVGETLKGYDNKIIRVVGHTDNVPVAKSLQATFPTNWELSVARATNVVRYLQEVGIPPERMIPAGRGEYEPVAENTTPEGRQKNRRIEIMLIDKNLVSEMTRTGS
ncbi:MAG: OmpA family protein, partial [Methanothrix sp.]|nr:OmpA family protein [Methanothrix sp.]